MKISDILAMDISAYGKKIKAKDLLEQLTEEELQILFDNTFETAIQEGLLDETEET
jgi:hypothetical protein